MLGQTCFAASGKQWTILYLFERVYYQKKIFFFKAVDDVLQGFFRVGEKGAVVSKQQLSDEFLNGSCVLGDAEG